MSAERVILIIGAGGRMTSRTARALGRHSDGLRFVLADISEDAARRTAAGMQSATVDVRRLDLYEQGALESAMADADFVVHGAGPFHKTAERVRAACLRIGADYMDIDDDVESGLQAIALDDTAKRADVALYVGCGASPGLTNILARKAIGLLDVAEDVEVAWRTAEEPGAELGRAVLEHSMHIGAGDCVTWREGRRVTHQSFVDTTVFPMGPAAAPTRLYECAHPETIAIPHSFPSLRSVTCWGGVGPAPMNGILKGVAQAERAGKISMDEACGFFKDVMEGRTGALKVWRCALGGVSEQLRKGEIGMGAFFRFVWGQLSGSTVETGLGVAARARGRLDGREAEVLIRSKDHEAGSALDSMEASTGLSQAAFLRMALESGSTRRPGCLFPEAWADPDRFLGELAGLGDRPDAQLFCAPEIRFLT